MNRPILSYTLNETSSAEKIQRFLNSMTQSPGRVSTKSDGTEVGEWTEICCSTHPCENTIGEDGPFFIHEFGKFQPYNAYMKIIRNLCSIYFLPTQGFELQSTQEYILPVKTKISASIPYKSGTFQLVVHHRDRDPFFDKLKSGGN